MDWALYLPEEWCQDAERRRKAKIPEGVEFQTKPELAAGLIERAAGWEIPRGPVLGDEAYGKNCELRARLDDAGIEYVLSVNADALVYDVDTVFEVPARRPGSRGPAPGALVAERAPQRDRRSGRLARGADFQTLVYRTRDGQDVASRFALLRVIAAHPVDRERRAPREEWLIVEWPRGRIQLEGFEILGAKARVREVVKRRLELAESSARGQPADAAALHRQAVVLQQLVGLYGLYEHTRRAEPPGPRRTEDLDQLAARMRAAGRAAEFDSAEVICWFHEGTDALRVIALNLMLANDEYRDFLAVLDTVDAPHSLFEHFYGLLLAEAMLGDLDALQRRLLRDAITRARRKRRFRRDAHLPGLSQSLLDQLGERA